MVIHIFLLGAGIKSVDAEVVIGDEPYSQILELSQLASYTTGINLGKSKIGQLSSLKCPPNFFSFSIYTKVQGLVSEHRCIGVKLPKIPLLANEKSQTVHRNFFSFASYGLGCIQTMASY